ncbi:hypothetical protein ACFL5Q_03805 [Planctomycetota bacterium]
MFRKSSTFSIFRCVLPILAVAALFVFTTAIQAEPPEGVTRPFMAVLHTSGMTLDELLAWDPGYMDDNSLMLVVHGGPDTGSSATRTFSTYEPSLIPGTSIPMAGTSWDLSGEVKHVTKGGFDGGSCSYYWLDDDANPFPLNLPPNGSRCVTGPVDNGGQLPFYEVFLIQRIETGGVGTYRVTEDPDFATDIVAIGVGTFTK